MSNLEVLTNVGTECKVIQAIRRWQLQYLGNVLRKEELEDVALTGKVGGKRARVKQRLTYIARAAKDRELWRSIASNFLVEYGT